VYREQVGENLQEGGSKGETSLWYMRMVLEAIPLGHTLRTFLGFSNHYILVSHLANGAQELLIQLLVRGLRGGRAS